MLDFSHLANAANGSDLQIFNAQGAIDWQSWSRPRGKRFARILAIGGGGGGGGGFSGASLSARGGGGGGGSAAYATQDLLLDYLPDILFLNVALGGIGGSAGVGGAPPISANVGVSTISLQPNTLAQNIILVSGGNVAGGGAAGSASAGGNPGGGANMAGRSAQGFSGAFTALVGAPGAIGGSATGNYGGNCVFSSGSSMLTGGAGGGGVGTANTDFSGGLIAGGGFFPTLPGGSNLTRGCDGPLFWKPFGSFGGTGGGTAGASGIAGAGGNAALGSGGGGGGGGVTGGAGGNGGNGLVIISCW